MLWIGDDVTFHVLDQIGVNMVAALLLASVVIRARRSYPVIRDLSERQRNTWALPLIAQGSIAGVILMINLDTLLETLRVPWLLLDLFVPLVWVCAFAPSLTLIWMGLRRYLRQAREGARPPEDPSPKSR